MKIFTKKNVYEAALDRYRYLFDEFNNKIVVCVSGGKDSTVILELALQVAKEKKALPLKAMFIDQEAEWSETIDTIKKIKNNPDIDFYWYQIPMILQNGTSWDEAWLHCWEENGDWIREKEKDSIHKNKYGTDRFVNLFHKIFEIDFPEHSGISGVRAEENLGRYVGMTTAATYKWITWGKVLNKKKKQYTFYPIFDWSYTDVWKYIHDNDIYYNKIYDYQYRYGLKVGDMRVSNLHHETSLKSLFYLQEVDNDLYNKLTKRLKGVDTAAKMGFDNYYIRKLPFMFRDWCEYRDFLIKKIVTDKGWEKKLDYITKQWDKLFKDDEQARYKAAKVIIQSVLVNDLEMTKVKNFRASFVGLYKKHLKRLKK